MDEIKNDELNKEDELSQRSRHHQDVSIIFYTLLFVVVIINFFVPNKAYSDEENRSLKQFPQVKAGTLADGSFFKDFESYYSDQFLMRNVWIRLKFYTQYIAGKREFSDVYVGTGDYLLTAPTEPDRDAINATLNSVNAFSDAYPDVNMYTIIVPDAAAVMKEKLPIGAPVNDQLAEIDAFVKALDPHIQSVDAAFALRNAYKNGKRGDLYYHTDHHWTSEGALTVFNTAAQTLGVDNSGVAYIPHTVTEDFKGTLSSRSGDMRSSDVINVYEAIGTGSIYTVNYPDEGVKTRSMFNKEMLDKKDKYTVFFGGNHALVEIETTAETGRNLLIFKDSYANSFVQFLTPYFDRIVLVDPRYYYDDIGVAMNTYAVTDVLYLYSADILFSDTALADTLATATD